MRGRIEIRRWVAVTALVVALIGGGLVAWSVADRDTKVPIFVSTAQAASDSGPMSSFSGVVKRTAPAVVNISTTTIIRAADQSQRNPRGRQQQPSPFFDDPMLREFFGEGPWNQVPRDRRESSLGSGVIVSPDGYLLTNSHVVEGATTVRVTLADRREFTAKIIGTDPQTDVAVIKIDATKLPVLPLSGAIPEVGDLALAIGNPFGVGQTVTMGIVGATGRNLGGRIEAYEDFIQTDAAINPGNSGGALVNTRGELIGINTAILSGGMSRGNMGIGFAIPVTMARNIMDQLIRTGKVTRGFIGATLQDVDTNLAKAFQLPNTDGAVITSVEPDAPAQRAGLREGDVITHINGESVIDVQNLRNRIAALSPGSNVKLRVVRGGKPTELAVTLAERPADTEARGGRAPRPGEPGGARSGLEGVEVQELTPAIARQLRIPADVTGIVVTDVGEASAAAEAGLRRGDVIEQVNRQDVRTMADFNRLVRQSSGTTLLMVNRGGARAFVAIER
jgi:serine protease Do